MNAYELADTVRRFTEQIKPTNNESDDAVVQGLPNWFIDDLEKSVNMLRQQADQIAELEKQLQESAMNCISAYAQADDHYAKLQELEKQSEPVAWMYVNDDGECEEISYGMPYIQDPDIQLLYTTPHHASDVKQTKLLTEDEIGQIWKNMPPDNNSGLAFARAIEAKVRGTSD